MSDPFHGLQLTLEKLENIYFSVLLITQLMSGKTGCYSLAAQLRYIWESEELRRAMEPVDLIRRVSHSMLCSFRFP